MSTQNLSDTDLLAAADASVAGGYRFDFAGGGSIALPSGALEMAFDMLDHYRETTEEGFTFYGPGDTVLAVHVVI